MVAGKDSRRAVPVKGTVSVVVLSRSIHSKCSREWAQPAFSVDCVEKVLSRYERVVRRNSHVIISQLYRLRADYAFTGDSPVHRCKVNPRFFISSIHIFVCIPKKLFSKNLSIFILTF